MTQREVLRNLIPRLRKLRAAFAELEQQATEKLELPDRVLPWTEQRTVISFQNKLDKLIFEYHEGTEIH